MVVTKQVYSSTSPFTFDQIANNFRSAFIDAGLMTDWYDSFDVSATYFHRILRIQYDAAKTYGTTYYWFTFNSSNNRISVSAVSGWNAVSHVPTGTQYVDYYSNATNSDAHACPRSQIATSLATTLNFNLIRYTSAIDTSFSLFSMQYGSFNASFIIAPSSHNVASWIDLDKSFFSHLLKVSAVTGNLASSISFVDNNCLRRMALKGLVTNGDTANRSISTSAASYTALGRKSADYSNNIGITVTGAQYNSEAYSMGIILPSYGTWNPSYTANYSPVVTGLPYSFYMSNAIFPADFGITPYYDSNTLQPLDKFIVSAGTEEWEAIATVNNATVNVGASMAVVARVV